MSTQYVIKLIRKQNSNLLCDFHQVRINKIIGQIEMAIKFVIFKNPKSSGKNDGKEILECSNVLLTSYNVDRNLLQSLWQSVRKSPHCLKSSRSNKIYFRFQIFLSGCDIWKGLKIGKLAN